MSNFKDMPLDATLQQGDIVTISGPGEHDLLVREVTRLDAFDNSAIVAGMVGPTADMVVILGRDDRTLTRVQRPVPALPTVEGDYILTTPGAAGHRLVVTLAADGRWLDARGFVEDHVPRWIEKANGIVRVIPADEVKRPEVDVAAAVTAFVFVSGESLCADDFESTLRRVLEGEFDL